MRKRQNRLISIAIPLGLLAIGVILGGSPAAEGEQWQLISDAPGSQQSAQLARASIMVEGRHADEYDGQSPFIEESVPSLPMPGNVDAVATDSPGAEVAAEQPPAMETPTPVVRGPRPAPLPEELIKRTEPDPAYRTLPAAPDAERWTTIATEEMVAVENTASAAACSTAGCTTGRCRVQTRCGRCARCRGGLLKDITVGGWLAQGITVEDRHSRDRFNGPVTFNDRDGEYQMNQLWFFAEKETDTGGCGWDIGGRVDFLYGTDRRFTSANGLEDDWNNDHRFYGAALPQLYMDVAVNDLTVRMGHFYTIIGYEVVPATDNFFYSHTYAMQYGEPFTHTGALATYDVAPTLSISGGFGRGWDNWEDNNNDLSFLGGITAKSCDGRSALSLALSTGNYDDAGQLNRTMYSLVFSRQVNNRLSYVIQYDWGRDEEGSVTGADAGWYGINNELFYCVNDQWDVGLRVEWFRDTHGTRVSGIGAPNGWDGGPNNGQERIGWAGTFWEITLGANWSPYCNVVVRPECRWDWYDGQTSSTGALPYNSGRSLDQFTFATDVVISF